MNPSSVKNIFWDVDGVLADLNHAYYHFLTGHPNYRDQFKGLKWEQLPEVLPILPEYGALELKTHPELGTEMDRDFCEDQTFFRNRPLYPRVNRSP
jgi:phosphoglycolate phosphatase-like HAD superfamily hydrolase